MLGDFYVELLRLAILTADLQKENERLRGDLESAIGEVEFFKSEVKLRNRIPSTSDPVSALQRKVEILRDAIMFYADEWKYMPPYTGGMGELYFDGGLRARDALKESE